MKLKPCPFCGWPASMIETDSGVAGLPGQHYVSCDGCWAQGSWENTKRKAAQAWNIRVKPIVKETSK